MSNIIYTQILQLEANDKNKYNYVYQITEISTGTKYIGSRGTKMNDPLLDIKKYKSSTKNNCFKINQKNNPLNYYYEILSYHKTREEATLEEIRLHAIYDVKCNPKYYNMSNQTSTGFSTCGKTTVKDINNNTLLVSIDDPRYLSGELVGVTKGHVNVKDKNGVSYYIDSNDIFLNNEFTIFSKNKISVKDKNGVYSHVDINDKRFLDGTLVGVSAGKVVVKDKNGNTFWIDKNDPRYLSGELISVLTGSKLTETTKNKISNS